MRTITNNVHRFTALSQVLLGLMLLCALATASATTVTLINNDGPGEGFNDNAAGHTGQTNNPGTTLGQQRLNAFQAAADYWEAILISSVEIKVGIHMDPQSCNSSGALLGSAGANSIFRDYPEAPLPNTWYVEAVANSHTGDDNDVATDDLSATFNSAIDNNNNCLNGTNWWYGINSPAPANTISFYEVVLHEIGHGIGVLSLVSINDGSELDDFDDAYSRNLYDEATGKFWNVMSNAERLASATNGPNVTWRGANADNCSDHLDAGSFTNGHIRIFAPSPVQPGSSISHWDTALSPDELMEPFATATSDPRSTIQLLKDVGWSVVPSGPSELSFVSGSYSVGENEGPATISVQRTCESVGAVSVTASTSDGSANSGTDYTSAISMLSWADGEIGIKTFDVTVDDDGIAEPAETVALALTGATNGATIVSPNSATLTISDPLTEDDFLLTTIISVLAAVINRTPVSSSGDPKAKKK
ncbi:MAG: hypothetical protein ACI9LY_002946 [Arenicella sp.]|jgi:hypothetical protein